MNSLVRLLCPTVVKKLGLSSPVLNQFLLRSYPVCILGAENYQHHRRLNSSVFDYGREQRNSNSAVSIPAPSSGALTLEEDRDDSFFIGPSPGAPKFRDPFGDMIVETKDYNELLTCLENDMPQSLHYKTLENVARQIFKISKTLSSNKKNEVLKAVGMQKFCKQIRQHVRSLDSEELITVIKTFVLLEAPDSHITLQLLFRNLSKRVNELPLGHIIYISWLLKRRNKGKSPLSKALEMALPVVFESQFELQIDRTDTQALCRSLSYASEYNLSDKLVNSITDILITHTSKMTPQNAYTVVWALADYKRLSPKQEPLVRATFQILTSSFASLTADEILLTMVKASRQFSKKKRWFYSEDFVDAVCYRCLTRFSKFWTSEESLTILRGVSTFHHVNIEYLEHMCDMVASDAPLMFKDAHYVFNVVRAFSNSNYKPEKWSAIVPMLLDNPLLSKDILGFGIIPLMLDFMALDLFPDSLVRSVFSGENLTFLDQYSAIPGGSYVLLLVYTSIKLLYPSYDGPMPPETMVAKWKQVAETTKRIFPLKGALSTGFGGDRYIISGILHDGLFVDHGVIMRKGGYPIAVKEECQGKIMQLNDIDMPASSVILLFKVYYKEAYATNTVRLRGIHVLESRLLEKSDHPVVVVDITRWAELPDHEKIPFLMHRVREKIEKFQWNQSSSDVIPS